jgi:hypothetical protein
VWGGTLGLQFGALQLLHPLHFGFTISQQLLPNIGAILSFYQKIEHTTYKKVIVVKLEVFVCHPNWLMYHFFMPSELFTIKRFHVLLDL